MEADNMDYVMQYFQVFTIMLQLNHLEYWLGGRHR